MLYLWSVACGPGEDVPLDGFWQGWCGGEVDFTTTTGDEEGILIFHQLTLTEAPHGGLTGEVEQFILLEDLSLYATVLATLVGADVDGDVSLSIAEGTTTYGPLFLEGRLGYDLRVRGGDKLAGDWVVDNFSAEYTLRCAICRADPADAIPYPEGADEAPIDFTCASPLL